MSSVTIIGAVVLGIVLGLLIKAWDRHRTPNRPPRRVDSSRATESDVRRLLADGRKIQAIKLYRELHGVGLKEAKEAVEALDEGA